MACGDSQGTLYLWDGQQSQERYTIKAYTGWVRSILLSPDAKYLASIAEPRRAFQLWEVESGEALGEFPNGIEAVAFSPNGDLVTCGLPKEILVWDIIRGEARFTLPHTQQSWFPAAVTFSPCGRYLVSGAMWHRGRGIKKVTSRLWDLHDGGKTIATFRGHPDSVKSLTFSPDGSLLASGSSNGTILLWDLQSVKEG